MTDISKYKNVSLSKETYNKIDKISKVICSVCNGNGFVRVPFEQAREEQWADCDFCNNQGEIEEEVDEDADGQRNSN